MPKSNKKAARGLYRTCQQLLVAILLLVLTACVPGAKISPTEDSMPPEIVVEESAASVAEAPTYSVVVTETVNLDAALKQKFDQAVGMLLADEIDAAITLLEQVVAADPGVTAPYIDLAIAYRKKDQTVPAEELLKKALEIIPGHPVASNEYGLLLRSAGRFAEARNIYSGSLELYPDYLPLHRNLGILCDLYLNDADCALEQYRYYSAARPDDEQAALWVSELQMRYRQ